MVDVPLVDSDRFFISDYVQDWPELGIAELKTKDERSAHYTPGAKMGAVPGVEGVGGWGGYSPYL